MKMAKKPITYAERIEVTYSKARWSLFYHLRNQAAELMSTLLRFNIDSIVHGSIARGDVSAASDIDVFIPNPPPSYLIEIALDSAGLKPSKRLIVQATPSYAIKGHIEIDDQRLVSFPMVKFKPREMDFYKFGGCVNYEQLRSKVRVPGVDKRLMLIEPTPKGHEESSIVGREEFVAKSLGIDVGIVRERVRTLLRRDKVGRTGVFIKRELLPGENFEEALRKLSREIPIIRKRLVLE